MQNKIIWVIYALLAIYNTILTCKLFYTGATHYPKFRYPIALLTTIWIWFFLVNELLLFLLPGWIQLAGFFSLSFLFLECLLKDRFYHDEMQDSLKRHGNILTYCYTYEDCQETLVRMGEYLTPEEKAYLIYFTNINVKRAKWDLQKDKLLFRNLK